VACNIALRRIFLGQQMDNWAEHGCSRLKAVNFQDQFCQLDSLVAQY
jgi:hypothetical protein